MRVKPAAQIGYGSKVLLQDSVNGDTGAGSSAIRITTGIFSTWRAAGVTCDHEVVSSTGCDLVQRRGCDPESPLGMPNRN